MSSLLLFEGRVHLALKEQDMSKAQLHSENAKTALVDVAKLAPTIIIPQRLSAEVMNYRTEVAIGRDIEEFKHYLIAGVQGAKALGSEKRRQEAIANWKAARVQWPHEKQIMDLAEVLF
jgi:glycine cleavage system protein P-like pyridoxal-binding family